MGKRKSSSQKQNSAAKRTKQQTPQNPELEMRTNLSLVEMRQQMLFEMRQVGYDGEEFANYLEVSVRDRIRGKRGRSEKQVRWLHYSEWAHALIKKEIGPDHAQYSFPPTVLAYIRKMAPGDIKGEIREDAHKVTMEDFCDAMQMPAIL